MLDDDDHENDGYDNSFETIFLSQIPQRFPRAYPRSTSISQKFEEVLFLRLPHISFSWLRHKSTTCRKEKKNKNTSRITTDAKEPVESNHV